MAWEQILVYPRVTHLITAETLGRLFQSPYPNLWAEVLIDLLNNVWVLDDHLERDNIPRGVDTLVGTGTANEGGLLGVGCISFGNCASCDQGRKQLAFDSRLVLGSDKTYVSKKRAV